MVRITETGVPKEEMETVCVWDALNNCWMIESSTRKHITRLLKIYPQAEIIEQYESGTPTYIRVKLEEDLVSFRQPVKQETRDKMSKLAQERFGKKTSRNKEWKTMGFAMIISIMASVYLLRNVWECYQVGNKEQLWFQLTLLAFSLCVVYHSYQVWTTPVYYYY